MNILVPLAKSLFTPGKGIIAMDDKPDSMNKRLFHFHIPRSLKNRSKAREIVLTTPNIQTYVSGIIFHEETLAQKTTENDSFQNIMHRAGMIMGIKVDQGLVPYKKTNEKITQGIESLETRLNKYKRMGAVFTKWRSVFSISNSYPTSSCIEVNSEIMSRFISLSQQSGFVPIIEPEVLMDGDHSIEKCRTVTEQVLRNLFIKLEKNNIDLSSVILKINMILPGTEHKIKCSPEQVAQHTIDCLASSVPHSIAGIVFLSGGQSGLEAMLNLNAIEKIKPVPWPLTFSFDRVFMLPILETWLGKEQNIPRAQDVLIHTLKQASQAVEGELTF